MPGSTITHDFFSIFTHFSHHSNFYQKTSSKSYQLSKTVQFFWPNLYLFRTALKQPYLLKGQYAQAQHTASKGTFVHSTAYSSQTTTHHVSALASSYRSKLVSQSSSSASILNSESTVDNSTSSGSSDVSVDVIGVGPSCLSDVRSVTTSSSSSLSVTSTSISRSWTSPRSMVTDSWLTAGELWSVVDVVGVATGEEEDNPSLQHHKTAHHYNTITHSTNVTYIVCYQICENPKALWICNRSQLDFTKTFVTILPIDLPSQILKIQGDPIKTALQI